MQLSITLPPVRSKRFQYRHTVATAAREIGVPNSWVWFWLHTDGLTSKVWLRCLYVRLEDVRCLFRDRKAVEDAFYATGEPVSTSSGVKKALKLWPDLHEDMYVSPVPDAPEFVRTARDLGEQLSRDDASRQAQAREEIRRFSDGKNAQKQDQQREEGAW